MSSRLPASTVRIRFWLRVTGVQAVIVRMLPANCVADRRKRCRSWTPHNVSAGVECRSMAWTHERLVGETGVVHAWWVHVAPSAMKDS